MNKIIFEDFGAFIVCTVNGIKFDIQVIGDKQLLIEPLSKRIKLMDTPFNLNKTEAQIVNHIEHNNGKIDYSHLVLKTQKEYQYLKKLVSTLKQKNIIYKNENNFFEINKENLKEVK